MSFFRRNLSSSASNATNKLPTKGVIDTYDLAAVQDFATNMLSLGAVNVAVLATLKVTGPTLLGFFASMRRYLEQKGMTADGALALTIAVERLRSARVRAFEFAACCSTKLGGVAPPCSQHPGSAAKDHPD